MKVVWNIKNNSFKPISTGFKFLHLHLSNRTPTKFSENFSQRLAIFY